MRIAFICSSLEPGRDGVGDYTRRLAAECIRQGHECVILALNDKGQTNAETLKTEKLKGKVTGQISEVSSEKAESEKAESGKRKAEKRLISDFQEIQQSDGTDVGCLRLSSSLGWPERTKLAREWLEDFNPDWVSLQYVCYGFHPRGLAWRWNPFFAELGCLASHRHLMFHELWIGEGGYSNTKRKLIGMGQRWIIRNMHRRFRPDVATTSNVLFKRRLARCGIAVGVLPLFGNIPVATRDDNRIISILLGAGSRVAQMPRAHFLNGVFFGGFHPDFKIAPLIQWLNEIQRLTDRQVLLNLIGRSGHAGEFLVTQLNDWSSVAVEIVVLGEQPGEIISQALQFADFGINTGSPEFLEKSGTFAAMREHGLPVVLADGRLDLKLSLNDTPPVLQFSSPNSMATILNKLPALDKASSLSQRATELIHLLEGTAN